MKSERIIAIVAVWLGVLPLLAQEWQSVTVNADSTVSFCYCGEGRNVQVLGDFEYAGSHRKYDELHPHKLKMQLGEDSCFHVTTPALVPELYTYSLVVDGKHVTDPCNPDTAWNTIHKCNLLTVGGTPQTALYQQPVQQGQLIRTTWFDRHAQRNRRLCVYLPNASNHKSPIINQRFPVLYLLHGISGYEGAWAERGRAIQILENMIAAGQVQPMVIVMPDCNIDTDDDQPCHHSLLKSVTGYPRLRQDRSLEFAMDDLIRHIEQTYPVSDRRAIAGLSSGARIAANIVKHYPGLFEAVGLFSPVVYKEQLPEEPSTTQYHIYTGKNDLFIQNGRRLHKQLNKRGITHSYTETCGAHCWRNWRIYLADFLSQL